MLCEKLGMKLSLFYPQLSETVFTTISLPKVKVNSKSMGSGKRNVSPNIIKKFVHEAKMLSTTLLVHDVEKDG